MAVATLLLIACIGFLLAALWMDLMFDPPCMAAGIFEVWQSGVRESWTRPYRFRGAHSSRQCQRSHRSAMQGARGADGRPSGNRYLGVHSSDGPRSLLLIARKIGCVSPIISETFVAR
jgi:hypothetical protein